MNRYQRVTIKDVAREVGVSAQTVSRVVNNHPDVSGETRQRVQDAIERLNYRPSAIARSLLRQHSYTIGLAIPGFQSMQPYFTLNGIASRAEHQGYSLVLEQVKSFDAPAEQTLDALYSRQVDGILWTVPEIGRNRDWLIDVVPTFPIPILFTFMHPRPGIPVVTIDNAQGGRLATQHLIDQGCRSIAHITGPLDWWEAQARKQAWAETLRDAGLPAEEHQWVEGDWLAQSGAHSLCQLLEQFPTMDGLFVGNDVMAKGALLVAHQQGIRVPDDLPMVGFDNFVEGSAYYWPPLTTVEQNQSVLGTAAVDELIRLIEAHREGKILSPPTVLLSTDLIVRQSSVRMSSTLVPA